MYGFNYKKLKDRIISKYGSMTAFASAAGCTTASVSLNLSGKNQFSQTNIVQWCGLLDISEKDIPPYFFVSKVK